VVGANNSGKSSILEATGLILRPPDPTQWVNAVRHRDIDMSLVEGLWSLFPNSEAFHPEDGSQESSPMIVEGATSGGHRRVEARCVAAQVLGTSETAELSARLEVSVDGDPAMTLKFPSPAAVTHQVPTYRVFTVTPATHYSTKALVEHLSRVVDEGRKQLAVELLQVFDSDVEDLDVIASLGREAVRVTHRTRGVVDLASFGDGMRRSVALALALTRASQGVLLVDEIEAGIHPSVLRSVLARLLKAAAAAPVQILATTHSLEAVDAIIGSVEDLRTPDSLCAFWLQRREAKHEVRRYDFAKLCTLREGGLDIR
jgi:energy-coupling factor transporter ATP-binding protein EcfA2